MGRLKPAASALVLTLLAVIGLAGCDGDSPEPTPTPTPTSATPSPTPTGPARAPDDPSWNADQLAAARVVDAYEEIKEAIWSDPVNTDLFRLTEVVDNPQLSIDISRVATMIDMDRIFVGGITPVSRSIREEQLVDGQREIVVYQCQEDDPGSYVIEGGVERPVSGNSREEIRYVVQWVERLQKWMVVEQTTESLSC
jgi:hypothetical protein